MVVTSGSSDNDGSDYDYGVAYVDGGFPSS